MEPEQGSNPTQFNPAPDSYTANNASAEGGYTYPQNNPISQGVAAVEIPTASHDNSINPVQSTDAAMNASTALNNTYVENPAQTMNTAPASSYSEQTPTIDQTAPMASFSNVQPIASNFDATSYANTADETAIKKAKRKRSLLVVIIFIVISVVGTLISRGIAEKKGEETVEICNTYGITSTQCKQSMEKNDVDCNAYTGQCTVTYRVFLFW